MANFALPKSRTEEAAQKFAANPNLADPLVQLVTEARDLFMKTKTETGRSGELGELILYMLVEWLHKAPIVACKMYLKTSHQMPIHGVDGVHIGFNGDSLIFYWGESKLHKAFASAIDDIVESVGNSIADTVSRDNEIRLIRANMNFGALTPVAMEALKDYFDPYKVQSNQLVDIYACLAAFDYSKYGDVEKFGVIESEEAFLAAYEARAETAWALITEKVKKANLHGRRFSYFVLPLPSVESARAAFQTKLWGNT